MKRRNFMMSLSVTSMSLLAPFTGCDSGGQSNASGSATSEKKGPAEKEETATLDLASKKKLVVYFSHSGKTREMARQIQTATGADLFEIVTVDPYPEDDDTVVAQAKKEQEENFRPAIKGSCDAIGDYDVVFLGSPNWWGTIGMAVMTFLESIDWAGKTVIPFMTHEGSGLGRTVSELHRLCPKSTFAEGHAVWGGKIRTSEEDVVKWLKGLGAVQ